ncbi:type II toxin-antitoxin system prevent-host-death family antitoxin [Glycomyces sp. A-F 0318]|uniref:type II toxin-antitoxin system Phd/YefM family antitoxin n=1 Tax=Glycomyces amatae TaxID=2881355 RepID=UPI001E53B083|nr:type II toxin-antitoxin system prevent-host-death family antitoxin [Glycomyces amatae]MCD0447169.1 type II toxin-antitoxin system prevent-host-death family antitoxin [Glycomyces amatae]
MITQKELRNDSAAVLRAAEAGEEIIVTRNGTPVARLMPLADESPFVPTDQLKASAQGLPRVDFRRLREDLSEHIDWEWRDPYERRND